jgi:hypothetical protein
MAWYSARLLYEFVVKGRHKPKDILFEEKVIVFRVKPDESLTERLAATAYGDELHYENADGKNVHVRFREVLEVQEIMGPSISDGTEVFYRYWDNPGVRAFGVMRETQTDVWWPKKPKRPK